MLFLLRLLLSAVLLWGAAQPIALASSLATSSAHPAEFTLSGRIMNPGGNPLPGAVVAVKGSSSLATTNSAGSFLLSIDQSSPVLQITCLGYQPQTLSVQAQGALAITLYPIGVAPAATTATTTDAELVPVANPALVIADVQPAFPGGAAAYREYISQNARYPDKAREANKEGAVFVSFVVDEQGRILDAQVLKGCGYGLDEEAVRLIRLMPWWTPGLLNGKPIKVSCTLRIRFGVAAADSPRPY